MYRCLEPHYLEGYIRWQLCYQVNMTVSSILQTTSTLISITIEIYSSNSILILLLETMAEFDSSKCCYTMHIRCHLASWRHCCSEIGTISHLLTSINMYDQAWHHLGGIFLPMTIRQSAKQIFQRCLLDSMYNVDIFTLSFIC